MDVDYGRRKQYALLTLLFARRGVLHPKHVTVFTANFMSPPTVGVAIWIVLVCSPETINGELGKVDTSKKINGARKEAAFSPRIGSNMRINGFES